MRVFILTGFLAAATAVSPLAAATPAGESAQAELSQLREAAQAGDIDAQRNLGAALVWGFAMDQDVPAGISLLRKASGAGDLDAKAILGKILVDGFYLPADVPAGRALLEEAAQGGNLRAMTQLGQIELWGLAGPANPERGAELLGAAAEAGDGEAMRVLGEELIGGWSLERDTERGLALMKQAIEAREPGALAGLSKMHLYGIGMPRDRARALELAEEAAAQGEGAALAAYGADMMWGQRGRAEAEALLRRAGELGHVEAWTTLAEGAMYGYLEGNRRRFEEFAEKSRAGGDERIDILEAERRQWGISMRASGPETLRYLQEAADGGNAAAAEYLIALVRDGNRLNVRKRPEKARELLDRYAGLLRDDQVARLNATITAAPVRYLPALAPLAAQVDKPELRSTAFGRDLFKANPNLAVYLLQKDMKARGAYDGSVNGLATRRTLEALWRECKAAKGREFCGDAVLRPEVVGALLAR